MVMLEMTFRVVNKVRDGKHTWTPYHMTAIAARLRIGQNDPQMPKEARFVTANGIRYIDAIRPIK